MIKAYYENSKGEVLWLTKAPFRTVEADWFDSTWEETDSGYEKEITIDEKSSCRIWKCCTGSSL